MSISTTSILKKMLNEAKLANDKKTNTNDMQKHVANVKLLCDLLLDEEETVDKAEEHSITPDEMKAMMGKSDRSERLSSESRRTEIDNDDANGKSIFDF